MKNPLNKFLKNHIKINNFLLSIKNIFKSLVQSVININIDWIFVWFLLILIFAEKNLLTLLIGSVGIVFIYTRILRDIKEVVFMGKR